MRSTATVPLSLIALVLASCAAELGDPAPFVDPALCPSDLHDALFAPRCGVEGCHVPYEPAGGLDFVSPDLAERMRGRTATTCVERFLVDPADPEASFLLERLSPAPRCGDETIDRMPLAGDHLTEDEMACVRAWVMDVARGAGDAE